MNKKLIEPSIVSRASRRILRLPSDAPELFPCSVDENGYLVFADQAEQERQRIAWDNEGWRGRLAAKLEYNLRPARIQRLFEDKKLALEKIYYNHKAARGLNNSRTITFSSPYLTDPETDWAVEGNLIFENNSSIRMTFISAQGLAEFAEDLAQGDSVLFERSWSSENDFYFSDNWVLISEDKLNEQVIEKALSDWYIDKFYFYQGHFSHTQGLPEFKFNIEWQAVNQ
jgi:hypothetical protein